jgi:hypothetical protein
MAGSVPIKAAMFKAVCTGGFFVPTRAVQALEYGAIIIAISAGAGQGGSSLSAV